MRPSQSNWLRGLRTYLAVIAIGDLAWETLQLPLYTIWSGGTAREQVFAVIHCTGGDLLIALATLVSALILADARDWPGRDAGKVAIWCIVFGIAYTGFSEWLNVEVRRSWAYSDWMPVISFGHVHLGVSPLLQWLVVPTAAHWAVYQLNMPGSDAVVRSGR